MVQSQVEYIILLWVVVLIINTSYLSGIQFIISFMYTTNLNFYSKLPWLCIWFHSFCTMGDDNVKTGVSLNVINSHVISLKEGWGGG
jgi:hypothetical protein